MPDKIAEVTLDELVWDSEFWGESAARIRLGEVSASRARVRDAIHSAQADFDFVQMLVPVGQIQHAQEAERAGFLVVDVRAEVALERGAVALAQRVEGRRADHVLFEALGAGRAVVIDADGSQPVAHSIEP